MYFNATGSEQLSILATIDPAAQAVGTVNTAWVPLANHLDALAIVATGALEVGATVDAKLQQATDTTGTGAKDIDGTAIQQLADGIGDNAQVLINLCGEDLDVNAGFAYVRLALTVAGAAANTAALLLGVNARREPADQFNQAAVAEVVA
jgi:hypothetical protein